jgi:hypothetical protein
MEVQMSDPYDQTRDPRTGRPPQPSAKPDDSVKREERDALETAVNALEGEAPEKGKEKQESGERPEALAQFAQSAREGEDSPKKPTADEETAPEPTSNADKHDVATRLLNEGAEGKHPDPHEEGVDKLPDRITDRE